LFDVIDRNVAGVVSQLREAVSEQGALAKAERRVLFDVIDRNVVGVVSQLREAVSEQGELAKKERRVLFGVIDRNVAETVFQLREAVSEQGQRATEERRVLFEVIDRNIAGAVSQLREAVVEQGQLAREERRVLFEVIDRNVDKAADAMRPPRRMGGAEGIGVLATAAGMLLNGAALLGVKAGTGAAASFGAGLLLALIGGFLFFTALPAARALRMGARVAWLASFGVLIAGAILG
ncbi:MAG: hypothetical protein JO273_26140, partial [Methylobacteriaceae bacterium]|nr:hypothetical protein [Methylobacteriaceae bacterium]